MSERTREPDRERRPSGSSQAAKKKKPPQSKRPVERRETVRREAEDERRRPAQGQRSGATVKKKKPAAAGTKKSSTAKKSSTSSYKKSKPSASRYENTSGRSRMEQEGRMSSREAERARRREERLRRVRRQKIIMAVSVTVIVLCLLTILLVFLSPAKCIVSLSKADKHARNEEYDEALAAYQEALEINEKSVRAYRGIAGCLRMKEQTKEAEEILYTGWEKTKDEGILQYYHKLLLNDAVADINAGNCTQETVDKLNKVLSDAPENLEAFTLLDTCMQRMSKEAPQDMGEEQPEESLPEEGGSEEEPSGEEQ